MTVKEIKAYQRAHDLTEIQELINSGLAWNLEGSIGRHAMACLKTGACYLPTVRSQGPYGNTIASRLDVKPGETGSLALSSTFWSNYDPE